MLPPDRIPVNQRAVDYTVVIDPTLDRRGRCETYPTPTIHLREWDEEVFLHESLHALLTQGKFLTMTPGAEYGNVNVGEEDLVRHLSHGIYRMGWRLVPVTTGDNDGDVR